MNNEDKEEKEEFLNCDYENINLESDHLESDDEPHQDIKSKSILLTSTI